MRAGAGQLLLWCFLAGSASSWTASPLTSHSKDSFQLQMSNPFSNYLDNMGDNSGDDSNPTDDGQEESKGQANTRFSKFAPDTNLSTEDFRAQLKENMKADLERRRREDPTRGNQPAKSYLDNL